MFKQIFLPFLLICIFLSSSEAFSYNYKILRVIDGDTIVFQADFLPKPLKPELALRIYGIDTPEKGSKSKCSSEKLKAMLASKFVKTSIERAKNIEVRLIRWDKYGGRVLGEIILDGKSLRTTLIDNGFAVEYFGGTKLGWCDQ